MCQKGLYRYELVKEIILRWKDYSRLSGWAQNVITGFLGEAKRSKEGEEDGTEK